MAEATIKSILYRFALQSSGKVNETPTFLKDKKLLRIDHVLNENDKNALTSALGQAGASPLTNIKTQYTLSLKEGTTDLEAPIVDFHSGKANIIPFQSKDDNINSGLKAELKLRDTPLIFSQAEDVATVIQLQLKLDQLQDYTFIAKDIFEHKAKNAKDSKPDSNSNEKEGNPNNNSATNICKGNALLSITSENEEIDTKVRLGSRKKKSEIRLKADIEDLTFNFGKTCNNEVVQNFKPGKLIYSTKRPGRNKNAGKGQKKQTYIGKNLTINTFGKNPKLSINANLRQTEFNLQGTTSNAININKKQKSKDITFYLQGKDFQNDLIADKISFGARKGKGKRKKNRQYENIQIWGFGEEDVLRYGRKEFDYQKLSSQKTRQKSKIFLKKQGISVVLLEAPQLTTPTDPLTTPKPQPSTGTPTTKPRTELTTPIKPTLQQSIRPTLPTSLPQKGDEILGLTVRETKGPFGEISNHVDGSIAVGGETDWVKVPLKQNQRVDFGFVGSGDLDKLVDGQRNIVIAGIYDSDGVAAINPPKESNGSPDSYTFFNPIKEDDFYVKLQARDTSLTGSYQFGVTSYAL